MVNVLRRGDNFVVVEKPAGLATQSPSPHDSVERRCRQSLSLGERDYLTAVHRLDRPVSGVLLLATTKKAARLLSQQFAERIVTKTYLAIVPGNPFDSEKPGIVTVWTDIIAKVPDQPRSQIVGPGEGKEAVTNAELVRYDVATNRSLVRLRPKTGRMHQLRVALAERGCPILGDAVYGAAADLRNECGIDLIALHAESLTFRDPKTAKWVTCDSSPPLGLFGNLCNG